MADLPARPATPQAMLHRLPDKPDLDLSDNSKPSKFIILIAASTAVAGKVQVAKAVSEAFACPLYQGDSLHETAARAATVGAARRPNPSPNPGIETDDAETSTTGPNQARYSRMWLSKMTRTGLLFPEESRAASAGFAGFGGRTSASSSRRGSTSSEASEWSAVDGDSASVSSIASTLSLNAPAKQKQGWINRPTPTAPHAAGTGAADRALMVLTHPKLERWHRECIRTSVGEYGIGIVFVPLDEGEGPLLKPLDPRTMTGFGSFAAPTARDWSEEIVLGVDVDLRVEELAEEITDGVRDIINS